MTFEKFTPISPWDSDPQELTPGLPWHGVRPCLFRALVDFNLVPNLAITRRNQCFIAHLFFLAQARAFCADPYHGVRIRRESNFGKSAGIHSVLFRLASSSSLLGICPISSPRLLESSSSLALLSASYGMQWSGISCMISLVEATVAS